MKRRIAIGVLAALGLSAVLFGFFAAERRGARASNTLRRELAVLHEVRPPRVPHVAVPVAGSTAEALRGLFPAPRGSSPPAQAERARGPDSGAIPGSAEAELSRGARIEVARILDATHAATGGLPDGLAATTAGGDSWEGVARAEPALLAGIDGPARCLDVLALGRDLAIGGGAQGVRAAHRLTASAVPACGAYLDQAPLAEKLAAALALQTMLDSAPSVPVTFREADLDLQLRTFGSWMRPRDLEQLSPGARALAVAAPPLEAGFLRRQRLLGVWSSMTKNARAAGEALTLRPRDRDERLERLERAPGQPALAVPWREVLRLHEERLALLRLLHLAAELDAARASEGAWRMPGGVEGAEVLAVEEGTDLRLTVRGTSNAVVLHPDAVGATSPAPAP